MGSRTLTMLTQNSRPIASGGWQSPATLRDFRSVLFLCQCMARPCIQGGS
jgi:hypothetical protein